MLNRRDFHAVRQQQRRRRRAERVRRVKASLGDGPVRPGLHRHRAREPLEVAHDEPIHRALVHPSVRQGGAPRVPLRSKHLAGGDAGHIEILANGRRDREVDPDRTPTPSAALLLNPQRRVILVLVEVLDLKSATGRESGAGVQVELEDGPVAVGDHGVLARKTHQLACPGGGQRAGRRDWLLRLAGDELRVGRVGHDDRQLWRRQRPRA